MIVAVGLLLALICYHPAWLGSITARVKTLQILVPCLLLIPTATWDKLPHSSMPSRVGDTAFLLSTAWIQGWKKWLQEGLSLPTQSACPV